MALWDVTQSDGRHGTVPTLSAGGSGAGLWSRDVEPGRGGDSLFLTQLAQRGGRERAVVFGSQVVTGGAVEEVRWCLCPRDPSCRDLSSVQPEAEWRVPDPGGAGGPAPPWPVRSCG